MEYTFYYELSKSSKEAVTYTVTYNYTTSKFTTSKFKTMLMYDVYKLDRHYFLPIVYEASKKGLKQFANDFKIAKNKSIGKYKIKYTK